MWESPRCLNTFIVLVLLDLHEGILLALLSSGVGLRIQSIEQALNLSRSKWLGHVLHICWSPSSVYTSRHNDWKISQSCQPMTTKKFEHFIWWIGPCESSRTVGFGSTRWPETLDGLPIGVLCSTYFCYFLPPFFNPLIILLLSVLPGSKQIQSTFVQS